MDKRWNESEFTKHVRLTEEDLDYIKLTKYKKTIAGRLQEIIEDSKNKYYDKQKLSS